MNILTFQSKKECRTKHAGEQSFGHFIDERYCENQFAKGQNLARSINGIFSFFTFDWQKQTFLYGFATLLSNEILSKLARAIINELKHRETHNQRKENVR